jgi:hypothetical protein
MRLVNCVVNVIGVNVVIYKLFHSVVHSDKLNLSTEMTMMNV